MKNLLLTVISIFIGIISNAQIDATLFSQKSYFSTGTNTSSMPHTLGAGDIDYDGRIDVVVPNSGNNTISIFRNINISGHKFDSTSFATKIDLTTLTVPMNAIIYDVNKDDKMDIVVAHYGTSVVSVFPGNSTVGNISFGTRIDFTGATNPSYVVFEDLDGDTKAEMIISNFGSASVSVFKNTSTTSVINFSAKADFVVGLGAALLKTADINGDGKMDIIVTNYNNYNFSVLKNKTPSGGAISFEGAKNFTAGSFPNGIDIYDINHDGKPDVAITNSNAATISVYQNNSVLDTFKFLSPVTFNVGVLPQTLMFAYMDADTLKDMCVTNRTDNTISIFKTKPGVTTIDVNSFYAKVDFAVSGGPHTTLGKDMDNNGSTDLVISNYASGKITVLTNKLVLNTSVNEVNNGIENKLDVFPNPFKCILNIPVINNETFESVILFDLSGRVILTGKENKMDTKNLSEGTYILEIKTDKNLYHQKVIKQD